MIIGKGPHVAKGLGTVIWVNDRLTGNVLDSCALDLFLHRGTIGVGFYELISRIVWIADQRSADSISLWTADFVGRY